MWLLWLAIICIAAFVVWVSLILHARLDEAYALIWQLRDEVRTPQPVLVPPPDV